VLALYEIFTIQTFINAEILGYFGRAVYQSTVRQCDSSNQNCFGFANFASDNVETPVHAIDKVHIRVPGWAKHCFGASRSAFSAMAGFVGGTTIGFSFGDNPHQLFIAHLAY